MGKRSLCVLKQIEDATVTEINGPTIIETLLLDPAPSMILPELRHCDLAAVAMWYIWWERRKDTHGETIQSSLRSAQAILALALNYKRLKK